MLRAEALHVHYGRAHILDGVSFALGAGEVLGLMGRNGAGKSTTLKTVIGLVRPSAGRIVFAGRDITGLPPHRIARLGIGYVPEERRIFADLTVRENLEVGRQPPRPDAPRWTPEKLFALFPGLRDLQAREAGRLSGGEQQMLTVARTLMGNPRAVLLDEPSEGLAPVVMQQMARTVAQMKQEGLSVLLCEQNLHFACAVADRVLILEKGCIRYAGTMRVLWRDEKTRRNYLTV